jgi:hypothetical protein
MGTTPIFGFPYPDPSDLVANYPALGQQLAEDVEDEIIASGGLSLISSTSFTTQATVSFNNCFSATYQNYLIVCNAKQSTDTGLNMRVRVGGVDLSGAVYQSAYLYNTNASGTLLTSNATNATTIDIFGNTVKQGLHLITILDPFATDETLLNVNAVTYSNSGTMYNAYVAGAVNNTTSYDGFTVYPLSGTLTGTIRVYGYKNS